MTTKLSRGSAAGIPLVLKILIDEVRTLTKLEQQHWLVEFDCAHFFQDHSAGFFFLHFLCFLSNFRQPPNDVEMALGGTLLPSISTFASGPTIKTKSIGSANLVSSNHLKFACQISNNAVHSLQFIKSCFPSLLLWAQLGRAPVHIGFSGDMEY